ncbi:MAG: virulence RhuM family protein, partial [Anaeroplasmataceae bacterium]|nr:virulence RhuM family protein [Anaeroplasmataceae bacterium]
MTQREMARLFLVSTNNVGLHIKNIIKDRKLDLATTKESSVVQIEGDRQVKRTIKLYNLDMIISVEYRLKSSRGIAFRRWANKALKEYLLQGYSV